MTVKCFNTSKEIYSFQTNGIHTEVHQHPILEIIISTNAFFEITIASKKYKTKGIIIPPNCPHQLISSSNTELYILMIESPMAIQFSYQYLALKKGVYELEENMHTSIQQLETILLTTAFNSLPDIDNRVYTCQRIIKESSAGQTLSISKLSQQVYLSTSRLSHLFKEQTGITIQQYQRWIKLRTTIEILLEGKWKLIEACYQAGFFDMAHFSKAFKQLFGINASTVYNSSLIQI